MRLWDVATGKQVKVFRKHNHIVATVAFSPDGRQAISASYDKTLKLWDMATGKAIGTLEGNINGFYYAAFLPNGKYVLAGTEDTTIKLSDISAGREIKTFASLDNQTVLLAVSSDGRYALVRGKRQSADKSFKLMDISKWTELMSFAGHSDGVTRAGFSNDGSRIKPTYENIIDNLNYLSRAGHNDVALLFIAGHGMMDDRGEFYFLPSGAVIRDDGTIKRSRAISWREIKSILDIPAKKLLFVDTCHSEGVSGKKTRGVDSDRLVKELQEANAVIFTSSRGRELSQESDRWKHGAFTYALVEGIQGKADLIKDNKISMKELNTYVSESVPKITSGAQHPITNTPDGYVNFPVAIVIEIGKHTCSIRVKEITKGKQTPVTAKPQTVPDFPIAVK